MNWGSKCVNLLHCRVLSNGNWIFFKYLLPLPILSEMFSKNIFLHLHPWVALSDRHWRASVLTSPYTCACGIASPCMLGFRFEFRAKKLLITALCYRSRIADLHFQFAFRSLSILWTLSRYDCILTWQNRNHLLSSEWYLFNTMCKFAWNWLGSGKEKPEPWWGGRHFVITWPAALALYFTDFLSLLINFCNIIKRWTIL